MFVVFCIFWVASKIVLISGSGTGTGPGSAAASGSGTGSASGIASGSGKASGLAKDGEERRESMAIETLTLILTDNMIDQVGTQHQRRMAAFYDERLVWIRSNIINFIIIIYKLESN